jgi:hypothetical protein
LSSAPQATHKALRSMHLILCEGVNLKWLEF